MDDAMNNLKTINGFVHDSVQNEVEFKSFVSLLSNQLDF